MVSALVIGALVLSALRSGVLRDTEASLQRTARMLASLEATNPANLWSEQLERQVAEVAGDTGLHLTVLFANGTIAAESAPTLGGGMGGAAMAGLGLALAQPKRRVLVITGDGEMLMGLGSLATIACEAPKNLAIAVIDNGHYGETGMQRAHTGRGVDIAGMAQAAGFKSSNTISSMAGLQDWLTTFHRKPGPVFADIKVSAEPAPMRLPLRDGTAIKYRFRTVLLGADAHK